RIKCSVVATAATASRRLHTESENENHDPARRSDQLTRGLLKISPKRPDAGDCGLLTSRSALLAEGLRNTAYFREGGEYALVICADAGVVVRVGVEQPAVLADDEDRSLGTLRLLVGDAERPSDDEVGVARERERNAESPRKLTMTLEVI